MEDTVTRSLAQRRLGVTLLSAFGGVAVLLAAVGLYGVLAFVVAQRRREIGVRIALGARPRDVVAAVLGEGIRLAAAGVAAGLVLALAASKLLTGLLFATSATDAGTFAAATALIAAIAIAASVVPAMRASRTDPLRALRNE
jgi:ABC-type antimicrobial peptide transport system permease subunit